MVPDPETWWALRMRLHGTATYTFPRPAVAGRCPTCSSERQRGDQWKMPKPMARKATVL